MKRDGTFKVGVSMEDLAIAYRFGGKARSWTAAVKRWEPMSPILKKRCRNEAKRLYSLLLKREFSG